MIRKGNFPASQCTCSCAPLLVLSYRRISASDAHCITSLLTAKVWGREQTTCLLIEHEDQLYFLAMLDFSNSRTQKYLHESDTCASAVVMRAATPLTLLIPASVIQCIHLSLNVRACRTTISRPVCSCGPRYTFIDLVRPGPYMWFLASSSCMFLAKLFLNSAQNFVA